MRAACRALQARVPVADMRLVKARRVVLVGRAQKVLLSLVLGVLGWGDQWDVVIVVVQLLLDRLSHLLLVFVGCLHP